MWQTGHFVFFLSYTNTSDGPKIITLENYEKPSYLFVRIFYVTKYMVLYYCFLIITIQYWYGYTEMTFSENHHVYGQRVNFLVIQFTFQHFFFLRTTILVKPIVKIPSVSNILLVTWHVRKNWCTFHARKFE